MKKMMVAMIGLLLFAGACVTPRNYECRISFDKVSERTSKKIDDMLVKLTTEFGFTESDIAEDSARFTKKNKWDPSGSTRIVYYHGEQLIKITTVYDTEEAKRLKDRIVEEMKKIVSAKSVKVIETDSPKPLASSPFSI